MNYRLRLMSSISVASVGGKPEADPREALTIIIKTSLERGDSNRERSLNNLFNGFFLSR